MLEQAYLDLAQTVLDTGHKKSDRTHTGTLSVFGYQMRFNLQEGFPLLTTKKCLLVSLRANYCGSYMGTPIFVICCSTTTTSGMNGRLSATWPQMCIPGPT